MPPDDNPLSNNAAPSNAAPEIGATSAAVEAIQEQLSNLTADAAAGRQTTEQMAAAMYGLQSQLAAAAAPAPAPTLSNEEATAQLDAKFEAFYKNPEGFIAAEAAKVAKDTWGPYLKNQAQSTADNLIDAVRGDIESEYGEGSWSELFEGPIASTLGQMPLEMRASKEHVDAAVASVLGRQTRDSTARTVLDTKRSEALKAANERAQAAMPNFLENGRPAPRPGHISSEGQDFLAELNKQGFTMSREEYIEAQSRGGSEDDWANVKFED